MTPIHLGNISPLIKFGKFAIGALLIYVIYRGAWYLIQKIPVNPQSQIKYRAAFLAVFFTPALLVGHGVLPIPVLGVYTVFYSIVYLPFEAALLVAYFLMFREVLRRGWRVLWIGILIVIADIAAFWLFVPYLDFVDMLSTSVMPGIRPYL